MVRLGGGWELSDLVYNERTKLLANALDRASTACFAVGGVGPVVAAGRNPVDVLVGAKLAALGLEPAPPADRRTLIRRATFDLTGLPPTPAEIEAFMPVRTRPNGHVELHARDQHARAVVVALTGAEAMLLGVHLTAHAAVGLDRTGAKVDRVLPPMIPDALPAVTADTPPGSDGSATGHALIPR